MKAAWKLCSTTTSLLINVGPRSFIYSLLPASRLVSPRLLQPRHDRPGVLRLRVPREQDPGVLAHLGDEGVDDRAAEGLGVDGGEVGLGQQLADDAGGLAGVDQVVDDEPAGAVAADGFQDAGLALVLLVVGADADRVDDADVELAGDDVGGDEAAAGGGDDAFPGALLGEAPGQRLGVAVELVPGHREVTPRRLAHAWAPLPLPGAEVRRRGGACQARAAGATCPGRAGVARVAGPGGVERR